MLRTRVLTAIVLLALFVPCVASDSNLPFALLTLLLIACAAWEWARLNQLGARAAWAAGVLTAIACAAGLALGAAAPLALPSFLWWAVALGWLLIGAYLLHAGADAWTRLARALRLALGVPMLGAAWLALLQAHAMGGNFLFSVLLLVWVADILAYFCGRAFGGRVFARKLAPAISPGKTWEGVLGAVFGVALMALVWTRADAHWAPISLSLYSHLVTRSLPLLLVAVVFLTATSVMGDLLEDAVQHAAGVKDSSHLLPGHGGVLDRIDALLPTLPLAMLLVDLVQRGNV